MEWVAADDGDVVAGVKQQASAAQAADSGSDHHRAHPRMMTRKHWICLPLSAQNCRGAGGRRYWDRWLLRS